jgi:hypothetical protein
MLAGIDMAALNAWLRSANPTTIFSTRTPPRKASSQKPVRPSAACRQFLFCGYASSCAPSQTVRKIEPYRPDVR